MNEIIYKDPVSFDKNCSLLMRANSVLYQERRKIYYFSISPFSLEKPLNFDPFGHARFAHLFVLYD